MSQILRLAGRIGVTSFKPTDKSSVCESCILLRHGFLEYSTQPRFEPHAQFFKRRRWKKKPELPDRKELHEQLSKMLHARVLQLSSTGRRSIQIEQELLTDSINGFSNVEKRSDRHMSDLSSIKTYNPGLMNKFSSSLDHSKVSYAETGAEEFKERKSRTKGDVFSDEKNNRRKTKHQDDDFYMNESRRNFRKSDPFIEDNNDKLQLKSADKFKDELMNMIQMSRTSSVPVQQSKHKLVEENVKPEFRKLPIKVSQETGNKKKHRKAALNEIYERKNDKIQRKKDKLKAAEVGNKTVFDTIHRNHVKSNLVINPEFREGIVDAKNMFEYKSCDNLSASDAKAALGLFDVLYDKHDVNSAVTNDMDALIEHENDVVGVDVLENENEDNEFDEDYQKIQVSDAEWDVLKKIRKRKSKFAPTLGTDQIHRREMIDDPFSEDMSVSDNVGLEDVTVTDWMESYKPIEGVLTEKAKQRRKEKSFVDQGDLDITKDGFIQEKVLIEIFNMDLKSYVEACVACRMTMRALEDVRFYRSSDKPHHKITDIDVYNTILRGLGREDKALMFVREVFSHIKDDGIQPNIQTYSLCISSIARTSKYNLLIASFMVKDMIKMGLDVRDIFNQCTFVHNERAGVYKMLKKLIPNYEPYPPKATMAYSGALVEPLNEPLPLEEKVEVNPFVCGMDKNEVMKAAHEQFCKELDQVVTVESVFKTQSKMDVIKEKMVDKMKEDWRTTLKEALLTTRATLLTNAYNKGGITMYPFFCLFPLDDYVDILCKELEWWAVNSQGFSPKVVFMKKSVADKIHKRFIIQQMIDGDNFPKLHKAYSLYVDQLINPSTPIHTQRECWRRITETFSDGNSMERPNTVWSQSVLNELGEMLYKFLIENAEVNSNAFTKKPERMAKAFYEVVRVRDGEMSIEIRPHPMISTMMNAQSDLVFNVNEVPSLCPPVPYTSPTQGGNFTNTIDTVRTCSDKQIQMFSDKTEECGPVLDSLNILSTYAWKINKSVLDVVLKVFKEGGSEELDIPILPDNIPRPEKLEQKESTQAEMAIYNKKQSAYKKEFMEATSLWWSGMFKLSIANQFRDKTFWIPMNMDFRGRTYPVASHLNHQGQDFVRALMIFAKGKPLGEKGFDWLKLHLINLTEFMKRATFEEKIAYADEIMHEILDSAENPLTGSKWWMKAENPWQALGVCYEIAAAVKSGEPATYVCHYPVHQDGSCNGLQHFAALGRDEAGAKSVNLISFERPADVYSDVVDLVMKEIEKDIAEKNEFADIAEICQPYLNRKVIKQSIMTTVYGVTEYGAKLQIQRRLEDKEFPDQHIMDARNYLTRKTFKCLNSLFGSARQIQDWFDCCSKAIAAQNETVEWNTPLNFPCLQPYYKDFDKPKRMPKKVYSFLMVDGKHLFRKVNAVKQKNGFSPNFIHSLDSVHMMLTSLYCYRHGLTYSSVHDSFWTHACDVDIMNQVTREQFIALHEQPILENLSEHFIEIYLKQGNVSASDHEKMAKIFTALPDRGDLDLHTVLNSRYFFS